MTYIKEYDTKHDLPEKLTTEDKSALTAYSSFMGLTNASNQAERQKCLKELKDVFNSSTQKSNGTLVSEVAIDQKSGHIILGQSGGESPWAKRTQGLTMKETVTEKMLADGSFEISGLQAHEKVTVDAKGSITYQTDKGQVTHSADDSTITIRSGGGSVTTTEHSMSASFPDGVHKSFSDVTPQEFAKTQTSNTGWVDWKPGDHFTTEEKKNDPKIFTQTDALRKMLGS